MPDTFGRRRWPTYLFAVQGGTLDDGWCFLNGETGQPMDFTVPGWSAKAEFQIDGAVVQFSSEPAEGLAGSISMGVGNVLLHSIPEVTRNWPVTGKTGGWLGGLEITSPVGEVDVPFSVIYLDVQIERVF